MTDNQIKAMDANTFLHFVRENPEIEHFFGENGHKEARDWDYSEVLRKEIVGNGRTIYTLYGHMYLHRRAVVECVLPAC